jgi:hypothetical protein
MKIPFLLDCDYCQNTGTIEVFFDEEEPHDCPKCNGHGNIKSYIEQDELNDFINAVNTNDYDSANSILEATKGRY